MDTPLAGKSTLNRMEMGAGTKDRYKKITFWKDAMDQLLVKVFMESHPTAPAEIVLDVDTTDLPLHGKQKEGSSWLLRQLLLSAAVHFLWRTRAVRASERSQS